MSRWTRFVEWCREPSKVKIRSFNPKNIMVIELSILIISLLTSGTWLFAVPSITQAQPLPIITSISGDGTKIAFHSNVDGDDEIFVVNSDGTELIQLTHNTAIDSCAAISGDGTKIAYTSNVDGDNEIFVVNSDGTGLTQLTHNTIDDREVSISGDGTKIAYAASAPPPIEIYVVNSDETGLTQLTPISGSHRYPSISCDGSKIAFHGWTNTGLDIIAINSDGTGETQLTGKGPFSSYASSIFYSPFSSYASISGDGSKIAFQSKVDGDDEIFVVNSDGTGLTQLTDNTATDLYASISDDGTKIAYTSNVNGNYEVFVASLESNLDQWSITWPETGFSFPIEYAAAGIVAVIVAVALVVILLVRKEKKLI